MQREKVTIKNEHSHLEIAKTNRAKWSFLFTLGLDEASKRRKYAFLSNRDDILSANERDHGGDV